MKTKTFKEVVRDIKRGETWVTVENGHRLKSISCGEDRGILEFNYSNETRTFNIDVNQEFVLDRKLYDFDEAYIELLNGRVIESESGNIFFMNDGKICKAEEGSDILFPKIECPNIECTDILGKWYVYTER